MGKKKIKIESKRTLNAQGTLIENSGENILNSLDFSKGQFLKERAMKNRIVHKKNNPSSDIKKELADFVKKAGKIVKLKKVILFGSRARGDSRTSSDIDIILISKNFENVPYYARADRFYLLWQYPEGVEIDIICLTEKELALKKKQIGIVKEAMKEGIEILK